MPILPVRPPEGKRESVSAHGRLRPPPAPDTIEDDGDPHEYLWVVYLKPTGVVGWPEAKTSYMWGTAFGPEEIVAEWRGPFIESQGGLLRGPVTFDIGVWEVEEALLWDWLDGWLTRRTTAGRTTCRSPRTTSSSSARPKDPGKPRQATH